MLAMDYHATGVEPYLRTLMSGRASGSGEKDLKIRDAPGMKRYQTTFDELTGL